MKCRPAAIALIAVLCLLAAGESLAGESAPAAQALDKQLRTVTIRAQVPEGSETVYLTGNCPELGNWEPRTFAMHGTGRIRTAMLLLPPGTQLEYKFTLGSWDREALGPAGTVPPNYRLLVDGDKEVGIVIPDFKKGTAQCLDDWKGSGVLGRLEYWKNVRSKFLTETRNVEIWLPPGYDEHPANRYDVLYMHDGQNLFDPRIANTGVDWGVDEAIVRGVKSGKFPAMIVVGVWCTGQRAREYSPWDLGTNYASFLIEELMPQVNRAFRTRSGPDHTSVMGSSMGGLMSFWLCWKYPQAFGRAGCLSTHFPWSGKLPSTNSNDAPLIEREIASAPRVPRGLRFYFDYGTRGIDSTYEPVHDKVNAWLVSQGLKPGKDFVVRKFPGADHNETAWRARLNEPLLFLFGGSHGETAAK
jgi:enterochelin esterase-like enzyme